jgi:hypothetical protein
MNALEQAQKICKDVIRSIDETGPDICLQTALQYPDGSFIDVFIRNDGQIPLDHRIVLSDLGQTTAWLLDLRLKPWLSEKRRRFVADTLAVYGATLEGGALEIKVMPGEALGPAVLRLAQACLRMADLMFTQRSSLETAFKDRVEEFFSMRELPFEQDVEIFGRRGRPVRVDYRVHVGHGSLVLVLGSANPSSAHTIANEIFTRWYDLNSPQVPAQKITLFDDSASIREPDLDRLRELSAVIALSEEDRLEETLRAA